MSAQEMLDAAAIQRAVGAYEDRIVDLTERLIRVPTENPPGREYPLCVELLRSELERLDLAPELIETGDDPPRACLRASIGREGPALYFHGHYDVVPAQDPSQFEPSREGDQLYGRGSADMKGGLAAMIYALVALRDLGAPGRVVLNLVPDEETGGEGGSRQLVEQGILAPDGIGMLTAEPTGGVVWNANRGAVSMRVTVGGRPAHVGLAYSGVNAFERMLDVAADLREVEREIAERRTSYAIAPDAARRSILLLGGVAAAGENFNVVPAGCSFTLDRRTNPEEDLAVEKQRLLDVFAAHRERGVEIEVEVFQEAPASGTPEDDPLAQALAASVEAVEGERPAFELCPGLLEIRWYAAQGLPALAYGPGRLDVSHQRDEHVEIPALTRAAAVYALTAAAMLAR